MEFENLKVIKTNDEKKWFMTTTDVAAGYGVKPETVRKHLHDHADEFRVGLERGTTISNTPGGNQEVVILYREGVIKLGFFVRSEQAKAFRQWATNIVCDHMDKHNISVVNMLEKLNSRMDRFDDICQLLRDEVDELKTSLNILISDTEADEIRGLIKRIKFLKQMDGRAIVGQVRKTLNLSTIYGTPDVRKVKNVLKNMLGEGLILQQSQQMEVK